MWPRLPMSCMAVSIYVRWGRPNPRVAWDGVRKKQLLDHDIIRLAGCVPQPPDSVPLYITSSIHSVLSSVLFLLFY